jgi:hypothetical protein
MKIGILGAGRIGISIAALLDIAAFVDTVILGDARMIANLSIASLSSYQHDLIITTRKQPRHHHICPRKESGKLWYADFG